MDVWSNKWDICMSNPKLNLKLLTTMYMDDAMTVYTHFTYAVKIYLNPQVTKFHSNLWNSVENM
jgi:hypothetical protein